MKPLHREMGRVLRPIKDIRFFEGAGGEGGALVSRYQHLGTLYPLLNGRESGVLGSRYAALLASHGFRTPGFHHVYITLRPDLGQDEVQAGPPAIERWMVHVDVGLPMSEWPLGDEKAQHARLIQAASQALMFLSQAHALDCAALAPCEAAMLEYGSRLEVTRLVKETTSYTLRVTYEAPAYGTPAPIYVWYQDHRTGRAGKAQVAVLKDWEDVFPVIARASVARGVITLSPRSSFRADLTTRDYETPLRISVEQLLDNSVV